MSMLDGISQCWWLSSSCLVDWNAWSAIATAAATGLALALALKEGWERHRKSLHEAVRSKIALYPHVHEAQAAVASLGSVIEPESQLILPNIEYEIRRVTNAVAAIANSRHQLGERDGLRLAEATSRAEFLVRQARRLVNGDGGAQTSVALREAWAKDARDATQRFLDLVSDYKKVARSSER